MLTNPSFMNDPKHIPHNASTLASSGQWVHIVYSNSFESFMPSDRALIEAPS